MKRLTKVTAALAAAGLAVAGAGVLAPAANATDDITGTITGGAFTQSLSTASFGSVAYSFSSSTQSASTTLSVSDLTGTADGWDITVAVPADLTASGTSDTIDNAGLSFTTVSDPALVAGQPIGGGGPVKAGTSTASLDSAQSVLEAQAGSGEGSYTQPLTLGVQLPARLDAGTYTGTFTVTKVAPTP